MELGSLALPWFFPVCMCACMGESGVLMSIPWPHTNFSNATEVKFSPKPELEELFTARLVMPLTSGSFVAWQKWILLCEISSSVYQDKHLAKSRSQKNLPSKQMRADIIKGGNTFIKLPVQIDGDFYCCTNDCYVQV